MTCNRHRSANRSARGTLPLAPLLAGLVLALPAASAHATDAPSAVALSADALSHEGWFDAVSVTTWPDEDRDGFASGLTVTLDADTSAGEIEAYARLALSGSDGVERLLYDTSTFRVRGRSSQDRVDIELDLLDAFPTDRYDLVVELRTARSDRLLDVVDRGAFLYLGGIELEDAYRDGRHGHGVPADDAPGHGQGHGGGYGYGYAGDGYGSSSYVAAEYAGSAGPLAAALLALLAALRWRSLYSAARPNRSPRDGSA